MISKEEVLSKNFDEVELCSGISFRAEQEFDFIIVAGGPAPGPDKNEIARLSLM